MLGATRWGPLSLVLAAPACCVARDARVRTPRGEVAAGSLVVGDRVESIDLESGRRVEGTIVQIRRATRECLALRWRGGALTCTPDHPLYSPERRAYRPASDWITGDAKTLLAWTGEGARVVEVEAAEIFAGVHEVVDLSLAAEPRNFVAGGVVVHNKTIVLDAPPQVEIEAKESVTLTATDTTRRVRIRGCVNGFDLPYRTLLSLAVDAADAPAPAGDAVQWLSVYLEGGAGGARFVDDEVPAAFQLDEFFPDDQSCSAGIVVGFVRLDDPPDGEVAVTITASFDLDEKSDAYSLEIEPEP